MLNHGKKFRIPESYYIFKTSLRTNLKFSHTHVRVEHPSEEEL